MSEITWLADFYSSPNEVDPEHLDAGAGELLASLAARLATGTRSLLPARHEGITSWYGIAPNDREARLLREELRCWLGPPISTRTVEVLNPDDAIGREARRLAGSGAAIRVDVAADWQATARRNVASLIDLWHLAPERSTDQPRPVGRVLRQFYEGLLAGERETAEASLEEIKSRALLSSTNIRFLRVELLSAVGTATELRDDPALQGISLLARPPAVTEHLAAAADALLIEPRLVGGNAVDWTELAADLEQLWPMLVTHLRQVTDPSTARCLALHEIGSTDPDAGVLSALRERLPDDLLIAAVAPPAAPPTEVVAERTPLELYHAGDYWEVLDALEVGEADRSAASIALASAMNIGDSTSAVRALAIVERLSEEQREALGSTSVERGFLETLRNRTSESKAPSSWLEWLSGDWVDRPDLLAEWARQWPRTSEVLEQDSAALAGELLDALNDARRTRVRNGFPLFVEWLVADGLPASGVSLASTVFDVLLGSDPGRLERQAAVTLLEEILVVGPSRGEYSELVEAIRSQLAMLGPRDAGWIAQSLGLLLMFAAPDITQRNALFGEALGVASSWASRAESADLTVLGLLFSEVGLTLTQAVEGTADARVEVTRAFESVGIYSLLESAARTAGEWIRKLFPTVTIRLSSEHVNSPTLESFARGSDVLLVQTSHAKHPATKAIEAAAERSRLVLVHGRGASALVRALLAWARAEP